MWKCPGCGQTEFFEVIALVTVRVLQSPDGDLEVDEVVGGDYEWDDDSPVQCPQCGRWGKVRDF
jgi:hypothetical protein